MKYLSKRSLKRKTDYTSGFFLTSKEVLTLAKHDFECCMCGKNLIKADDFPTIRDNEPYCEECYIEQFYTVCEVCEDNFPNIDFPTEDEHIYINKELYKETGYQIGIYKVLSKPFFYGSILTGFDAFFNDTLELIKAIDLDKYYNLLYRGKSEIGSGCICPDCVKKFTNTGYIKPLKYWNPKTEDYKINVNRSINIRSFIKGVKI